MLKYFKPNWYFLFICIAFILIDSCNSDDKEKKDKDDTVIEKNESAKPAFIGGVYDTLWVDRSAFNAIGMGTKMAFSYTFKADDKLTLGGWIVKNPFDTLPVMQLENGHPGKFSYGPGTFFSGIVLPQADFNKLKTALIQNPAAQYVLFAPTLNGRNFRYKIFLSNVNPTIMGGVHILALTDTDGEANPSPPKDY